LEETLYFEDVRDILRLALVVDQNQVNGVIHETNADIFVFGVDYLGPVGSDTAQEGLYFFDGGAQFVDKFPLGFDAESFSSHISQGRKDTRTAPFTVTCLVSCRIFSPEPLGGR
jgi:hypothetical protein